jgi:hypothetical protein
LNGLEGLKQEELKIDARKLSEKIKMEDGLKEALRIVERHVQQYNCSTAK